ncbi:chromatin remodeling complex subunit [Fistulina hepatica ATCC 64428]|uniref:Chromatin remodeling complex subunit n=1 Tax=Fistulina hepatica ATCC 64428 TaxID=1128425 RepID=A0A0D7AHH1_9AGAR|nr:chromatin remodeling complex subunit [Fistulina hepatica ATCC 64428]
MEDTQTNITYLPPVELPSLPPPPLSHETYREQYTPLVIDNGSSTLRWGFATYDEPFSGQNVIAKFKERKTNRPLTLFGEAVEMENASRIQARYPWEGDVLTNFDALENALDYAFIQLGIDTPTVDHPVLMTERIGSLLHSRSLTSELLFEQYSVPSVAYCIDSLMSFYKNNVSTSFASDGLVLSFNTASTSVIPVLQGKGLLSHAKRIPWGASQASEYLLKLVQLKYANFPTRVTISQANWMFRNLCEFAIDYPTHIRALADPLALHAADRIVQFPYVLTAIEEKTEEELAQIAERRKEQGRKLQEMAMKNRAEKLVRKEQELQELVDLKESKEDLRSAQWLKRLEEEDFENEDELDEAIKKLETHLRKAKKKDGDADEPMEEPSYPLLDVPDEELDEEALKEKRKQRLMKAGFDARMRARKEKEREREEKEQEERLDRDEREHNLQEWSRKRKHEHQTLMTKIKGRARRRAALSDRKSAAAQARMKNIANLAAQDDRVSKKKRKGNGEDNFGADDADWAIYRQINTVAESSDEEQDLQRLIALETQLLAHDPTFTEEHTHAALTSQRSALLTAFKPVYDEGDSQGNTRIHLNVERWRACETWFAPGMAGVDSAGLGEVVQSILARFSEAERGRLVNNVFLTGAPAQMRGLIPRVHASLRPIMPPGMPINVVMASDPVLDAWKGMAAFSLTDEFKSVGVTRAQYDEFGGERIKKWWAGNWNGGFIP